mmetsp:Transcript_11102/g.28880  ORF Transcript_11102/g.28880 Transcript_11102/m.28880 type:complete len:220 (+) Transcript_11102:292-951(+)
MPSHSRLASAGRGALASCAGRRTPSLRPLGRKLASTSCMGASAFEPAPSVSAPAAKSRSSSPKMAAAAAAWSTTLAITHSTRARSCGMPSPTSATMITGCPPMSKCSMIDVCDTSANDRIALNSRVPKPMRSGLLASAPRWNSCRSPGAIVSSVCTALSRWLSSTSFLTTSFPCETTSISSCSPDGRFCTQSSSSRGSAQMRCGQASASYMALTGTISS